MDFKMDRVVKARHARSGYAPTFKGDRQAELRLNEM